MSLTRLTRYLDEHNISYSLRKHPPAYTSQEIAAMSHISGKQFAKTVMVKVDGRLTMVVIPANDRINLERLTEQLGASQVELASEHEFVQRFPDCDRGGMPPFGNLWDLPVVVSTTLARDFAISFNAGNHVEVITMTFADYRRLVHPRIVACSERSS